MGMSEMIKNRRSIRDYRKGSPPDQDILKVLEAGRWAPSGLNNQPWRFMVIRDDERKDSLAARTTSGDIIRKAPILIVVFFDTGESYSRDKDFMAIGACVQNMLLEAHAMGLGTCWLGEILNRKEEIKTILKIAPHLELAAVIAVGYLKGPAARGSRKALKRLLIRQ